MTQYIQKSIIARRLGLEQGTLYGQGRRALALVYPSPYEVGMSSLGYQTVYRLLNHMPDTVAERVFLPDTEHDDGESPLLTYESQRLAGDFPVLAFSVAYELEITGVFTCLKRMGVPALREERTERHPWVVMGGPLTFSNPIPLAPFADLVVMGEAESLLPVLMDALWGGMSKKDTLRVLADTPGFYVPSIHGEQLLPVAAASDTCLPAHAAIVTPETSLSNMFLLEAERGCSRGCTFCVMRRSTNGGMRTVPVDKILATIPDYAKRVGLVGAAVSDHPRIVALLRALVESGREVGVSSLRADRLTLEFVQLLVQGGYRTLTVASDGASERLRVSMEKKIKEKHLLKAAEFAREAGIIQLKNYMMVGVPGETEEDLNELIAFTHQQADVVGGGIKVSLGVAPFVAKKNTPLDGMPFVGIAECERRLEKLRKGLHPRIEVRPTSARWAWVEYLLAQGGADAGLRAHVAWSKGGSFSAWKKAFNANA